MSYLMDNRVVVVTGCSRGLGKVFVESFAKQGAKIGLIARDGHALEDLAETLSTESVAVSCDVTDANQMIAAYEKIGERFGGIDSVVANAGGLLAANRAEKLAVKKWREVIELNLTGAYITARMAYTYLRASHAGRMIFVSSAATKVPPHGSSAYIAAKAGVEGLTRALCAEWAQDGIRVNALAPGFMDDGEAPEIRDVISRRVIDRTTIREPGRALDLANTLIFLASDACEYMTGQVLSVDGGYGLG